MYSQNLHTHGVFCDGKDNYEDTVLRAIELGFTGIGFSGHAQMSYAPQFAMSIENTQKYKDTVNALKKKYDGKIDVFCGVEFDMYSEDNLNGYDYVIGSVHYLKKGNEVLALDRVYTHVKSVIDQHYGGNGLKLAKDYYEAFSKMHDYAPKCDIIGHLDIIAKNNERGELFDENSNEYKTYAIDAVRELAKHTRIFEINTGAIIRGYRTTPYPAPFLLKEIKNLGCDIVISSDCHDNAFLNAHFDTAVEYAKYCGFTNAVVLTKEGFRPVKL